MSKGLAPQRFDLDLLGLDPDAAAPLYRQLQDRLRATILEGRLRLGERLPSIRRLALTLGVARNTVAGAFDQLTAEGYLRAAVGSGTRVSDDLPERLLYAGAPAAGGGPAPGGPGLSARGTRVAAIAPWLGAEAPRARPFRPHLPALDAFPRALWERLSAARARRMPRDAAMGRVDPLGYRPLREAVSGYLGTARGVRCTPDQVVITAGSQQGLDLIARLLLDPGDSAWIEEPGYTPAAAVFELAGATVVPVPVGPEGLDVAAGEALAPRARLVYVTPASQWPLGVTMTPARRLELLAWAGRADAWILEDDYNGEFRFAGRPLPALQGLDRGGRVIYMGTFSKVLFPALRLGYLVVPGTLARAFGAARWLADRHSPPVEQAALADFIDGGHFARHIRRMRTLYAERQAAVVDAAARELAGEVEIPSASAGMHLIARAAGGLDEATVLGAAVAAGVENHPVARYSARGTEGLGLVLGFAAFSPEASRRAVRAWARALTSPRIS